MNRLLASGMLVLLPWAALAQPSPDDADPALTEVVVTGTRLQNANFTAPTPVQVMSSAQIEARAPANIADVVNEIPSFRVSRSATGSGRTANFPQGVQQTLDLRGLSDLRTLVLINGQRTVGTNSNGSFDTNMIPISLIDRVEVVTGGASAAYGSDAVAGVANFILRNKLEGITGSVQAGRTTYGDGDQYLATLSGGTSFASGRGHAVLGMDYAKTEGVGNILERPYGQSESGLVAVTPAQRASLNLPAQYFSPGVRYANATPGSLIQARASDGNLYAFDAAGNPFVFNQGTVFGTGVTSVMTGGTSNAGITPDTPYDLQVPNTRKVAYARADFDVTDDFQVFAEGNYGKVDQPVQQVTWILQQLTIPRANLPASIAGLYTGTNVVLGRMITEFGGGNTVGIDTNLNRFVVGGSFKFADKWSAGLSYQRSRSHEEFDSVGIALGALYKSVYNCNGLASTAVGGNPNLTGTLAAQAVQYEQLSGKTCVPFNPLGVSTAGNPAVAYSKVDSHVSDYYLAQDHAVLTVNGAPFTLSERDISLAVGAEWRRDKMFVVGDAYGNANLMHFGNFKDYGGTTTAKELFAEVGIPLLADLPLAKSLDLNGAVRRTDYSLSGPVTTWKYGGSWEPLEALRVRVTQSRDIRAPYIRELRFLSGASPVAVTNIMPGTFGFGQTRSRPAATAAIRICCPKRPIRSPPACSCRARDCSRVFAPRSITTRSR